MTAETRDELIALLAWLEHERERHPHLPGVRYGLRLAISRVQRTLAGEDVNG